jgi:hypothetical protein
LGANASSAQGINASIEEGRRSESSCLPMIVLQQTAQPLAAYNHTGLLPYFRSRLKDLMVKSLMRTFSLN